MKIGKRGLTGKKLKGRTGVRCNAWKGGRFISRCYVCIYLPKHPMSNKAGYALEHRIIMSKNINRFLSKDEIVHHKDGNKMNNNINNLEITNRKNHLDIHRIGLLSPRGISIWKERNTTHICSGCKKEFFPKRKQRCERIFCSKICFLNSH
jgi:hypothetical protein